MNNELKQKLASLPHEPGCYLWKQKDKILYIGKAKDLKKRTSQYFLNNVSTKTKLLVSKIDDIDYIVVNNENESLILENNLIKKYQPPYNVLLKEGTNNYPYIVVTNEKHPRLIYTRKFNKFKGKHYGPFANNKDYNAYSFYLLLNRIFGLRKCHKLPQKECIYYHLKQCIGPCINKIDPKQYVKMKDEINDIFNNKIKHKIDEFKELELKHADNLEFEQAEIYKQYIEQLQNISTSQIVQLNLSFDTDIIGYYEQDGMICIIIFNFINGKLLAKHEAVYEIYDNDIDDVITSYLSQYYKQNNIPKKVYINLNQDNMSLLSNMFNFEIIKPIKGKYVDLIVSAVNNAKEYLDKNMLKIKHQYDLTIGAQKELSKLLKIDNLNHIEAIDNSNIFLQEPVSGVVVFKNGVACNKLYRKYNLRSVINKSDYHFMLEVMVRRYSKLKEYPDLLIVDGGLIQLRAAKQVLNSLELSNKIKIIGLQKDDKHRTNAIITESEEIIHLERDSYLYRFLSRIQDEVHRFAINFYRQKSVKSKMNQFLDEIEGLGSKSKQKIIKLYPNIYDLKNVELSTIEQIIPKKAAKNLKLKIDKELK